MGGGDRRAGTELIGAARSQRKNIDAGAATAI
jgi:hypothetical protein